MRQGWAKSKIKSETFHTEKCENAKDAKVRNKPSPGMGHSIKNYFNDKFILVISLF